MAEEGIILPDEPILIVERGWNTSSRRSTSHNQQTTRFDVIRGPSQGLGSEVDIPVHTELRRHRSQPGRRDFQFVEATEPDGRHDSAAQRRVRSHVRKQSSRKEAGLVEPGRRQSVQSNTDNTSASVDERRASVDVEPRSSRRSRDRRSSRRRSTPPEQERLTDLYTTIRDIFYPLARFVSFNDDPIQVDWYHVTMVNDDLLFKGMQLVATLHKMATPESGAMASISSLMKSIHEQLIIRIGQGHISDATIGVVLCLATAEYYLEDDEKYEMHRKGASNMLQHRGGIDQVDSALGMRLRAIDIAGATDQLTQPYLQHQLEIPTMLDGSPRLRVDSAADIVYGTQLDEHSRRYCIDMISFARQIEHAIRNKKALNSLSVDEACTYIQYKINATLATSQVDQILRFASMFFMKSMSRGKPFITQASRKTSTQLQDCFESQSGRLPSSALILWAAVLGAIASRKTPNYNYFLKLVKEILNDLDCSTWSELKDRLKEFLWIESIHDYYGWSLWLDIEGTQPKVG